MLMKTDNTKSLIMKRKSGLPIRAPLATITSTLQHRSSAKLTKKVTGKRQQSQSGATCHGIYHTVTTTTTARTSEAALRQHSVSTSNTAAVQIQNVMTLTGLTPRQKQNQSELTSFAAISSSCLQKSSSLISLGGKDKQQSTGATSTRKSSHKVPKLIKSSTQSRLAIRGDTITPKTSSTTLARKQQAPSSGTSQNMKDMFKLKPVLQTSSTSRNFESQQVAAAPKQAVTSRNVVAENTLNNAKKVSSPDSLIVPRKSNRNPLLGSPPLGYGYPPLKGNFTATVGLNLNHTSGSSMSNTIVYFGETTSQQPSGKTHRKEQLHQMPYCQSTKVGSFQLHSGTTRSDNDTGSQIGTRNHSVGKTPYESSTTKPTGGMMTLESNRSTAAAVRRESSVIYAPPPTKQIKLTLSPVREPNSKPCIVRNEYNAITKQMVRLEHPGCRKQQQPSTCGHLSQSRGDVSEDGQVQLSDLEPLSNLMDQRKPAKTVIVHLTDLKNNSKTQVSTTNPFCDENDQAGSCDNIQIQIQHNKSAADVADSVMDASLQRAASSYQRQNEEGQVCQFAQCDASFESPDVLEAARKRGRSRCGGIENGGVIGSGSSIQILPSSLIADKRTNSKVSSSMRQQALIQSAQSYMMRMSQSLSSSQQKKPNPRMQALDLRSPVSKACAAPVEDSLRWSVLSSSPLRRSVSEIPDEYQSNQKPESKTLDKVAAGTTFEYQMGSQDKLRVRGTSKNLVQATPKTLSKQVHPSKKASSRTTTTKMTQPVMIPKVSIDLKKQTSNSTMEVSMVSATAAPTTTTTTTTATTRREQNLQAALLEIRKNSQRSNVTFSQQDQLQHRGQDDTTIRGGGFQLPTESSIQQQPQQQPPHKQYMHSQKPSLCYSSEVSHLNMLVTTTEQIPTISLDNKEATLVDSQKRTEATADFVVTSQLKHPGTAATNNFSSQVKLPPLFDSVDQQQKQLMPKQLQQCLSRNITGMIDVVVTDWTDKLKDEPSAQSSSLQRTSKQHQATIDGRNNGSGVADDEVLQTTSRAHCPTEMETQQTQIVHYIEGGILITESCTDGEAIVAAETDEFYGQAVGVNQTRTDLCSLLEQQQNRPPPQDHMQQMVAGAAYDQTNSFQNNSSNSGQDDSEDDDDDDDDDYDENMQADTTERVTPQLLQADVPAADSSEPLETQQSGTENEDLILENVQNFINMAYLQKTYMSVDHPIPEHEKVQIDLEDGKRLLLLDMDETLIHAATTVDIEINQVYGPGAVPDFVTSFRDHDQDSLIEIGVFKRPFLQELIERALPYFQICIYTASEKMYADAILDVLDPNHTIFYKRLYRDKCLRAVIPSPVNHPLQDLLPGYVPPSNSGSNHEQQLHVLSKNSESYDVAKDEESSSSENNFYSNLVEGEDDASGQLMSGSGGDDSEAKTVYIKDLRVLKGVDLSQVVIVDNQLLSFALQPDNGIPISSYFFDPSDAELRYVADYLLEKYELMGQEPPLTEGVTDLRLINKQQFKLSSIIEHALNAHNSSYQQQSSHLQQNQVNSADNSEILNQDLQIEESNDDTIDQTVEASGVPHRPAHQVDYHGEPPQSQADYEDSQVQQQYAMHLKRGKELRRQRISQMMQCENGSVPDFDPGVISSTVTPWQKATQILDLPAHQAPSHQRNCRYDQLPSDQSSSYDSFARLSALQTSQALYDQTHGTIYSMSGRQLSHGELLSQPIRSQIVTEVPEALETTQKMDRRRDCIFQVTKTTSNDEEEATSEEKQQHAKLSIDITPQVLKIKHQHSSSWNRPSLTMLSGADDLITP